MKPSKLLSQFNELEEPEDALTFHISQPVDQFIEKITNYFLSCK